jgi:histidyl-tRNA synthetase
VAIRPEMTPTLARMVAAKVQELPKPIRWYSIPNLWRYERPQRGRLREFWQLNVDILGGDPLLADAEILEAAFDTVDNFENAGDKIRIRVNHRKLMDHFFTKTLGLNAEQATPVTKIIDAKAKLKPEDYLAKLTALGLNTTQIQQLDRFFNLTLDEIVNLYPEEGAQHLHKLWALLAEHPRLKAVVEFDATILRGLDYYTGMVFEIFDTSPENRRALFGGGRYDGLISMFGKESLSGVGFGMGDAGLENFLTTHGVLPKTKGSLDIWVGLTGEQDFAPAAQITRALRQEGFRTATPLQTLAFGPNLKQATKHGAPFAILFGSEEAKRQAVVVKNLSAGTQEEVSIGGLTQYFVQQRKEGKL